MVLFNLKKDASHVRQQMASSLIEFCRASFKYDTELNIEGMVCVTVDKQDVLPIPVNILLQKTSKAANNSGLNASFTQSAAAPKNQTAKANTSLDMQSDLQSAQAVLQSLLAKTPSSQQPDFMPLADIGSLTDSGNKTNSLQPRQAVKVQAVNEDDIDMEDDGGKEDIDEGIHSQDSQSGKAVTLQESVGNVIKNFYQGNNSSPLQQSTVTLNSVAASTNSGGQPSPSPLTVIKVIQPNTSAASRYQQNLTPHQKLASALSWKHEAPKKFQCPMCKYTSDRRFCINRHMKLHVGRAGVQCQICQNIFADHWYLTKVHMPKHHPEHVSSNAGTGTSNTSPQDSNRALPPANSLTAKECSIKCPVCPFTASSAISFRNHLNTHSRDCLKCGLRFLTPEDVQQHVHQQHGDDVDFSEYIYDPDMAQHLEDDALRTAIHLTPPSQSPAAATVVGDKEGVGAQGDSLDAAIAASAAADVQLHSEGLYHEGNDDDSGGGGGQVPLFTNHNYMMVVNDANQVELYNSSDGTVVAGIVDEEGQIYKMQEVPVEQLIKKEGEGHDTGQNGDDLDGSEDGIEQVVVSQAE